MNNDSTLYVALDVHKERSQKCFMFDQPTFVASSMP